MPSIPQARSHYCQERTLVSTVLGQDEFVDLIMTLPNEFFKLPVDDQDLAWKRILGAVNDGIRHPKLLADLSLSHIEA